MTEIALGLGIVAILLAVLRFADSEQPEPPPSDELDEVRRYEAEHDGET